MRPTTLGKLHCIGVPCVVRFKWLSFYSERVLGLVLLICMVTRLASHIFLFLGVGFGDVYIRIFSHISKIFMSQITIFVNLTYKCLTLSSWVIEALT